jgi:hypothetical protein
MMDARVKPAHDGMVGFVPECPVECVTRLHKKAPAARPGLEFVS